MLVLSRKAGETIRIGTEIEMTVISIRNNRVKLAFEGPAHVRIMRAELLLPASPPERLPATRRLGDVVESKAG